MIQRFKLLCTPACEIAIEKLVNAFEIPRQARGTGQAPEGFACGLTAAGLAKQKPQTPKSLKAYCFGGSLAAWRMFVSTNITKVCAFFMAALDDYEQAFANNLFCMRLSG